MKNMLSVLATLLLGMASAAQAAVGFQRVTVPDSDAQPCEVGIWYPSDSPAAMQPLGPHRQTVANGGAVAAVNHGQNIRLVERPRHVGRVLDYMLAAWSAHDRLDPERIGIFGFSVGGFTALVTIGGTPDLGRIPSYCSQYPDRLCSMTIDTSIPVTAWVSDKRIKAAVVAAPTLGFTFGPSALAPIRAPIQLWRAGRDEITPHPRHAEAIYNALPTKPDYIVVPDAGHFAFISCSADMATRSPVICRDAPEFNRQEFHRMFNAAVLAFFKTQLTNP